MSFNLEQKKWWGYIEGDLQKLLQTSEFLLQVVKSWGAELPGGKREFHDYSFIVFPAAKAYEGFLKKLFLDSGFISQDDYFGKHFRIGKALNPSLPGDLRKESIYDKIVNFCGGRDLADRLWETWKEGRNLVFHWFPNEKNAINLKEAEDRINMIISAMDAAFKECKIKKE
jgi:hypothetical protein